ncbi:MAG: GGDEF domain-containing protein [Clostridia bacterium]|nr:GGDEF domain-containing protein [Clostridia bacterium]
MKDLDRRLNVGVFLCHLNAEYVIDLSAGIIHAAADYDVNIRIFPAMYVSAYNNPSQPAEYDYQINTIYDYAIDAHLDIIIISLGTLYSFIIQDQPETFLDKFKDMTLIIMEEQVDGYYSLMLDNKVEFGKCVEHLIVDHGYKKIAFINGKKNNRDSEERLAVYLNLMEKYQLPVDPSWLPYGNFSKYCDNTIDELLDKNPDLEALCCANDMMALVCYRVLKKRGLTVGKDIAITGFDDVLSSFSAEPPMSTVSTNVHLLGYRSVVRGIEVYHGRKPEVEIIPSQFMQRVSCGCSNIRPNIYHNCHYNIQECVERALTFTMHHLDSEPLTQGFRSYLTQLFELCMSFETGLSTDEFTERFSSLLKKSLHEDWFNLLKNYKLNFAIKDFLTLVMAHANDPSVKQYLNDQISAMIDFILSSEAQKKEVHASEERRLRWLTSRIVRESLINANDINAVLTQMLNTLHLIGIRASYLYLFDAPIIHNPMNTWHKPQQIQLVAYHHGPDCFILHDEERITPIGELFDNKHVASDERQLLSVYNLFLNNEQYGLLVCDLTEEYLGTAYTVSLEISTAFKFLNINRRLMNISTTDELTHLYNRRGFFDQVNSLVSINTGKTGILFFADLDNLKIINDCYGHEAGDQALISAASILKQSFRRNDVIARIGGDEFIAFALLEDTTLINHIENRIDKHTLHFNSEKKLPYFVELSYGYTTLTCTKDITLNEIIKQADELLYERKKQKRPSPLRGEGES